MLQRVEVEDGGHYFVGDRLAASYKRAEAIQGGGNQYGITIDASE